MKMQFPADPPHRVHLSSVDDYNQDSIIRQHRENSIYKASMARAAAPIRATAPVAWAAAPVNWDGVAVAEAVPFPEWLLLAVATAEETTLATDEAALAAGVEAP